MPHAPLCIIILQALWKNCFVVNIIGNQFLKKNK